MDSPKAKVSDQIHANLLSVQLDSIKTTTKEFWKALQGNLLTNLSNLIRRFQLWLGDRNSPPCRQINVLVYIDNNKVPQITKCYKYKLKCLSMSANLLVYINNNKVPSLHCYK